jgi:hypothetical protein
MPNAKFDRIGSGMSNPILTGPAFGRPVNSNIRAQIVAFRRPMLKMTGYSSAERVEDVFGSHMVDLAYAAEVGDGYVLIAPDDPEGFDLSKSEDRDWLAVIILETMKIAGEPDVSLTLETAQGSEP